MSIWPATVELKAHLAEKRYYDRTEYMRLDLLTTGMLLNETDLGTNINHIHAKSPAFPYEIMQDIIKIVLPFKNTD